MEVPNTILTKKEAAQQASGKVALLNWSGLETIEAFRQPRNSQEIFSVYALATGCSLEDAMNEAAQTLLSKWKDDYQAS